MPCRSTSWNGDADALPFFHVSNIAERVNDSYSSSVALGLTGCSLTQIVFNTEMTPNLLPIPA
jgi:cell division protein FtsW (lipid II flippase)